MNEEKYIITIDGPDCTGKTYTWTNLQRKGVNVQIRGILSNIAYGLKYGRNVDEMKTLISRFCTRTESFTCIFSAFIIVLYLLLATNNTPAHQR